MYIYIYTWNLRFSIASFDYKRVSGMRTPRGKFQGPSGVISGMSPAKAKTTWAGWQFPHVYCAYHGWSWMQKILFRALVFNVQMLQKILFRALIFNVQMLQNILFRALIFNVQMLQKILFRALVFNVQMLQKILFRALIFNVQMLQKILFRALVFNVQILEFWWILVLWVPKRMPKTNIHGSSTAAGLTDIVRAGALPGSSSLRAPGWNPSCCTGLAIGTIFWDDLERFKQETTQVSYSSSTPA